MQTIFHPAGARGYADHGWLATRHSFSFADYYDPEKMGFGALRVINDDRIAPGQGFGRHPHQDMEIITIPLSGALAHEDSMGNAAVIETGEIQVMSAGTGVAHSEFNASQTEVLTLLQIWILSDTRNAAPRYDQKRFDPKDCRNQLLQVVGKIGEEGVLGIHQDARLSLGQFDAGQRLSYALERADRGAYLFVIEGGATVAGKKLKTRDALGVWDAKQVAIAIEKDTRLLVIGVPMG